MKKISDVVNVISFEKKKEERKGAILDPRITDIINKLFAIFYSLCRGFEKQYRDPKRLNIEKTQWIKAFMDMNLDSLDKIKYGIKRTRLESPIYTPTIGQFIKWCTPTTGQLGIPSLEDAYDEACRNAHPCNLNRNWSHQVVYHAAMISNLYDLANLPRANTFPVFERNYDITVKMLMNGEQLRDIPLRLESDDNIKSEQQKCKEISKPFAHCNSFESGMGFIKEILGISARRNVDKSSV